MKIGPKLILGYVGITILISGTLFIMREINQTQELGEIVKLAVNQAQTSFFTLQERDIQILSATLQPLLQDPSIKDTYLSNNRDQLFQHNQPLFNKLKQNFGITHWYFINPSGHTFLRQHNQNLYDDKITRSTFWNARNNRNISSGIELGKTAYALRVVTPYYQDDQLIGYMELGEEIDHFLDILKGTSNNEFAIVADKQHLDHNKWTAVRHAANLPDNWYDQDQHVIISTTGQSSSINNCAAPQNISQLTDRTIIFQTIIENDRHLHCAGFPLIDAGGHPSGFVIGLFDVTEQNNIIHRGDTRDTIIVLILVLVSLAIGILTSRSISKPIANLALSSQKISRGNLTHRANINTKDEIGQLAKDFNHMTNQLIKEKQQVEVKVQDRTAELEKTLKYMTGRELRMHDLKQQIKKLTSKSGENKK